MRGEAVGSVDGQFFIVRANRDRHPRRAHPAPAPSRTLRASVAAARRPHRNESCDLKLAVRGRACSHGMSLAHRTLLRQGDPGGQGCQPHHALDGAALARMTPTQVPGRHVRPAVPGGVGARRACSSRIFSGSSIVLMQPHRGRAARVRRPRPNVPSESSSLAPRSVRSHTHAHRQPPPGETPCAGRHR